MSGTECTCAQCGRRVPAAVGMCECGWPRLLSLEPLELPEGDTGEGRISHRGLALFLAMSALLVMTLIHVGQTRRAAGPAPQPRADEPLPARPTVADPPVDGSFEPRHDPAGGGDPDALPALPADEPDTAATEDDDFDAMAEAEDERAAEAAAWRERRQSAAAEVAQLTAQVEQLNTILSDIRQNFFASGRADSLHALQDAKSRLLAAQEALEALDEEGRHNSFWP